MIIDFHTHCFPDALAPIAIERLKKNNCSCFPIHPRTDGTATDAEALLKSRGISRAVVCNIATNTKQEFKVNSFAISLLERGEFFSPLGSIHPDSENKTVELDRLRSAGIRGVKLHPDYVRIPISDSRYDEIFSLLEEREMFTVVHAGFDPVSPELVHVAPQMLLDVIRKHRNLKLIAAHMGGMLMSKEVIDTLVGTNIYLDTSLSSIREKERENLYKILENHDEDRILFGTDTPWTEPREEIEFVMNAKISESKKEKIFSLNAKKLLCI